MVYVCCTCIHPNGATMFRSFTLATVLIAFCSIAITVQASDQSARKQREQAELKRFTEAKRKLHEKFQADMKRLRKADASGNKMMERTRRYSEDSKKLAEERLKQREQAHAQRLYDAKSSKPGHRTSLKLSSSPSRTRYVFARNRVLSYVVEIVKTRPKQTLSLIHI